MELKFSDHLKNGATTCRLCSKEDGVISIFSTLDSVKLFEQAMFCAEIKISLDDGLPDQVCETCSNHLVESHRFRIQCEASDRSFRSIVSVTSKVQEGIALSITPVTSKKEEEITLKVESTSDNGCHNDNHITDDDFDADTDIIWAAKKTVTITSGMVENKILKSKRRNNCSKCQCPVGKKFDIAQSKSNSTETDSLISSSNIEEHLCSCNFPKAKRKGRPPKKVKSRRTNEQKFDLKTETNDYVEDPTEAETKKAILRLRLDLFEDRLVGLEQACLSLSATDTSTNSVPTVAIEKEHRKKKRRKSLNCGVCLKTYSSTRNLQKHLQRRSCNTKNNDSKVRRPRFTVKGEIDQCLNEENDIKAEEIEDAINGVGSVKIDRDMSRSHMCDQCGRTFRQRMVLQQHMHTHSDVKMYACDLCSKRFTRKAHVVAHLRIHDNIKPYVCETCGRSFNKSSDLGRHRRIHSDARNFPCPLCGRGFKRSGDIASHMRSHTGDRPYKCVRCDKSYTTHSSLQKHRRAKCTADAGKMDQTLVTTEQKSISTLNAAVLQQNSFKIV